MLGLFAITLIAAALFGPAAGVLILVAVLGAEILVWWQVNRYMMKAQGRTINGQAQAVPAR